jgi:hypothetical protein
MDMSKIFQRQYYSGIIATQTKNHLLKVYNKNEILCDKTIVM